jgi:hypothetical protein
MRGLWEGMWGRGRQGKKKNKLWKNLNYLKKFVLFVNGLLPGARNGRRYGMRWSIAVSGVGGVRRRVDCVFIDYHWNNLKTHEYSIIIATCPRLYILFFRISFTKKIPCCNMPIGRFI